MLKDDRQRTGEMPLTRRKLDFLELCLKLKMRKPEEYPSLYPGKKVITVKQYRKMKKEWRLNSKLNRSQIQGLGLYARRDIDPGTFIIEYTGELIRKDMTDARENYYDQIGKGTYMFRLSDEYVIDATIVGGAARYINHNCDPNCVAETVNIEGKDHIIIISNRFIFQGEELCYDYKFDVADDGVTERVACLCRAVNCRKWMN